MAKLVPFKPEVVVAAVTDYAKSTSTLLEIAQKHGMGKGSLRNALKKTGVAYRPERKLYDWAAIKTALNLAGVETK